MSGCSGNWLLYTNVATGLLFVISEILSLSKCQCNGIVQLFFTKSACMTDREVQITLEAREPQVQQRYFN